MADLTTENQPTAAEAPAAAVPQAEGLRKRATEPDKPEPAKSEGKIENKEVKEVKLDPGLINKAVMMVGPGLTALGKFSDAVQPLVLKIWAFVDKVWTIIQLYQLDDLIPALLGLTMVFFGGHFVLTIATVEAFRMGGWDRTSACLSVLWANYKKAVEENTKDNQRDDNNDGIPDVQQIDKQQLASRKMMLLVSVCDPVKLSEAVGGLHTAVFAVLATLRIQFARIVTLGITIGSFLSKLAEANVRGPLEQIIPEQHHKWITPLVSFACKSTGISLAWIAGRFLAAFQSGIRGAQLLVRSVMAYLKRKNYISATFNEHDPVFMGLVLMIASPGIWWQVTSFFRLPFPLNVLLWPFSLIEWLLSYMVGDVSSSPTPSS